MSDVSRDESIPDAPDGIVGAQPIRDRDSSIEPDPDRDPAQAEWDRTSALDDGASIDDLNRATATGADPAEIPDDLDEIPRADLPGEEQQPETQGVDPEAAELGEDGQGDLAPEDL
ncbi:UNVERIFIED_CONTAM: sugar ABC transporter ATPase [Microbacterium sp. SLM126]